MSLGSILSTARSGMLAAQRAAEVTANNVANANTVGYSRQRVEAIAERPIRYANGEFGAGVRITSTTRARDQFLDANFRRASADASGSQLRSTSLARMETVLGEPNGSVLGTALDAFYGAWSDLSARPTVGSAQAAVQQAGAQLALQFNRAVSQLDAIAAENSARLESTVHEVNALAERVATLNRQIVSQEAAGVQAPTLRDARDQHLDRLAQLTGAQVIEHEDGSVGVLLGGLSLVDGVAVRPIATNLIGGRAEVTRASVPGTPIQLGGELGALRQVANVDIPAMQADLDALARGVVDSVNTLHRQGVTWSGTPPVSAAAGDFFASDPLLAPEVDPLRTARGIRLDSAVAGSTAAIAASAATATGPGEASIALQLAGLRTTAVPFTAPDGTPRASESAGAFLQRIATDLAFTTRSAADREVIDDALMTQSDTRRQEVSGVSVDEEMVRLIKFQQAYAAAARMINTADSMMQTLLDLKR